MYQRSVTKSGERQDVLVYAEGSPEWQRTKRDLVDATLVLAPPHIDTTTEPTVEFDDTGSSGNGHHAGQMHGLNRTRAAAAALDGGLGLGLGLGLSEAARESILHSSQLSATWLIIRRSPQSIAFVNDWLSACLGE